MRMITQIAASAVVVAVAVGGWYAWDSLFSGGGAPSAAGAFARPGGGPPGRGGGFRALEVVAAEARRDTIVDIVEAVGTAKANEAVLLTAKQSGIVARIVFTEGQRVKQGDVIVEFEAREKKADLETAKAQHDEVSRTLERARQLRATGAATQARVEDLQAQARAAAARVASAEARRADLMLAAPFPGRVGMRQVSPGALVQPGTAITTLDDISTIKVEFAVPQTVLGRLKPGLIVRATTNALKDRAFNGQIAVIDTRVDPVTRSVRAIAKFDNGDEALRPGLFLNIELEIGSRADAVVIPEEAVVSLGTTQYVFRIVDGRAVRTEVVLGSRKPGVVEIVQGVAPGERVIVQGLQKVRDGTPVRVPQAQPAQPPAAPKPSASASQT
jgi:membrane fusion protein (multidrug efflux system)